MSVHLLSMSPNIKMKTYAKTKLVGFDRKEY
mgnify:CR=1 FL=1